MATIQPNPQRIFVGNLPKSVLEQEFKEYFEQFGSCTFVEIKRRHTDGASQGFGFVEYGDKTVADSVLEQSHQIQGASLALNYTLATGTVQKYFIGNLDRSRVNEQNVKEHFSKFGQVDDVFFIPNKMFGYVTLTDQITDLTTITHTISDVTLKCEKAKPKGSKPRSSRGGYRGGRGRGGYNSGYAPPPRNNYGSAPPQYGSYAPPPSQYGSYAPPPPAAPQYGNYGPPPNQYGRPAPPVQQSPYQPPPAQQSPYRPPPAAQQPYGNQQPPAAARPQSFGNQNPYQQQGAARPHTNQYNPY